jgi:hypothetical protein
MNLLLLLVVLETSPTELVLVRLLLWLLFQQLLSQIMMTWMT